MTDIVAAAYSILTNLGKVLESFVRQAPRYLVAAMGLGGGGCGVFLGAFHFYTQVHATHNARKEGDSVGVGIGCAKMARGVSFCGLSALAMASAMAKVQHVGTIAGSAVAGLALGAVFYASLLGVSITRLVLQVRARRQGFGGLQGSAADRVLGKGVAQKYAGNATELSKANFRQIVISVIKIFIAILGLAALGAMPHIALVLGGVAGVLWFLVGYDTINEKIGNVAWKIRTRIYGESL